MTDLAFEQEYEELHGLALTRARRVVGNDADAEEIAQETMLRAYSSWSKVSAYAEPWTLRVATNLAISHLRRHGRDQQVHVVRSSEPCTARVDVTAALETLPPRQRQVAVLRHVADLPEEEVAESLGISVGSVKRHLHRAMTTLKSSPAVGAAYDKAFDFRQHAIKLRQELSQLVTPAPEPPGGWPQPPWDTVALVRDGAVRYRAVDTNGEVILDADGNEVVHGSGLGFILHKPVARDFPLRSAALPLGSLDAMAQHAIERACEVAERFGEALVSEGALGVALAECLGDVEPLALDLLLRGLALEQDGPHAEARLAS